MATKCGKRIHISGLQERWNNNPIENSWISPIPIITSSITESSRTHRRTEYIFFEMFRKKKRFYVLCIPRGIFLYRWFVMDMQKALLIMTSSAENVMLHAMWLACIFDGPINCVYHDVLLRTSHAVIIKKVYSNRNFDCVSEWCILRFSPTIGFTS